MEITRNFLPITEGREPSLATLRESGVLEQDADIVIFLHQDNEKCKENTSTLIDNLVEVKVLVAKNRNGPTGTVTMDFIPKFIKFIYKKKQLAKISC
ncbi:DnaB-like helicase C-terminal domain-containing protein [Borreliella afzelii]|uniref:DnaB-like helicase C-terminal domain-containing protein n=1 Tax=Borreliella afzelii TaxID=29518 RepID=UPI00359463CD